RTVMRHGGRKRWARCRVTGWSRPASSADQGGDGRSVRPRDVREDGSGDRLDMRERGSWSVAGTRCLGCYEHRAEAGAHEGGGRRRRNGNAGENASGTANRVRGVSRNEHEDRREDTPT